MNCVGGIVRPYEGLAFIIAKKFFPYCGAAVDFEDLLQAGAIGAWRAQNTFDETQGSWANWAALHMTQEMQDCCMVCGNKKDPCLHAASLDAPLPGDDEGRTLCDTLDAGEPDPLEDIDREQVARIVREAVDKLRDDRRRAVQLVDLEGMTQGQAAELLGLSEGQVAQKRQVAFEYLRRDKNLLSLKESLCFRPEKKKYKHVSIREYLSDYYSSVENDVLRGG